MHSTLRATVFNALYLSMLKECGTKVASVSNFPLLLGDTLGLKVGRDPKLSQNLYSYLRAGAATARSCRC